MTPVLFRASFISLWLSRSVIPDRKACFVRPSTFLPASRMAVGQHLVIAPALLAYIYNMLNIIVTSNNPSQVMVSLPLPIIHVWLHLHYGSLYQKVANNVMKSFMPSLIYIVGASPIDKSPYEFRKIFTKNFSCPVNVKHRILKRCLPTTKATKDYSFMGLGFQNTNPIFAWLVSIRPRWLPFRIGEKYFLELYFPQQVARNFGFSQEIPKLVPYDTKIHYEKDWVAMA